jgi:hypothetical protein
MMKLDLGRTIDGADYLARSCEYVAADEYGADAAIVKHIQAARAELAEARRLYDMAQVAELVTA